MIDKRISHYEIIEKLGEGGMGVVYKARDTKLDRLVAVKFLPHHLVANEAERARFLQEARAASALNHPNVCTIHDIAQEGEEQFIVMEYVDGSTLRKTLPVQKAQEALAYAVQIADALTEAHGKGIVHRDIKSENIMVNGKNQIKVMDFGLAKLKGSLKLTKTSSTIGTLAYMAPEQIQGGEVDTRSDIFSFGVLLFEMLTGHLPFRGEHEAAMMYSILNEEPEPVRKTRQEISPEIEHIILRALEKDPEDRYQTVADMAGELRREQKKSTRVGRLTTGEAEPRRAAPALDSRKFPAYRSGMKALFGVGMVVLVAALILYLMFGRRQAIDSLAVLPFENAGGDPNTEYLSDGITESLINTLSQLSHLAVRSRASAFYYKGKSIDPMKVGKDLGVKAVLVGRVTQRGDDLQISAELVDVSTSNHIWGEQYTRKLAEILTVQQEIAKEISRQLSVTLAAGDEGKLANHSTENTQAYQLYLKGRFHWNKRTEGDLQKAADYFNQAIQADPGYALAYSGLALVYSIYPEYASLPSTDFVPKIESNAKKALELNAALAEPHAALGNLRYSYQFDWEGANREFLRAIELDPNNPTTHHWYANCLLSQKRLEEALSEARRAMEVDPLSLAINVNVADMLLYLGRFDQAHTQLRRTLDLDPNFRSAHRVLAEVYACQGKYDSAIGEMKRVRENMEPDDLYGLGMQGSIYARAGRREESSAVLRQLLDKSRDRAVSAEIAWIYAGLGDREKAFAWLEKGLAEKNTNIVNLKVDVEWDPIRSDPRFAALLAKMNLSP